MRLPIDVRLPATSATSSSTFAVDPLSKQPLLIELQGTLETGTDGSATTLAGATIGQLDLSQPNRPQLLIAHHLLTGKVVKLDKPLAVLKHTFPSAAYNGESNDAAFDDGSSPAKKPRNGDYTSSPEAFRNQGRLTAPKTPVAAPIGAKSSSPLPTSPATPSGTVELREGKHEIIGVIRTKLQFSKRPDVVS